MDVPQKQTCPQCRKAIDAHARICLFCNFRIRTRDAEPLRVPLKFPAAAPPDLPEPEQQTREPELQIAGSEKVEVPSAEIPQSERPKIARGVHLKVSLADDDDVPDMPDPEVDPDQPAFVPRPQFTLPQLPPRAPELLSLGERLGNSRILRATLIVALVICGIAIGRLAVRTMLRSGAGSPAAGVAGAGENDLRARPAGRAAVRLPVPEAERVPQASALSDAITAPILPPSEEELAQESARSEASAVSPATMSEGVNRADRTSQRVSAIRPKSVERKSRSEFRRGDEEYEPGERVERPVRQVRRTRAVPIDRPLPDLDSRRRGTVRLELLVGADGTVKEITVVRALSGVTAQIIDAVQQWEFRPATLNGKPVSGSFDLVLSF